LLAAARALRGTALDPFGRARVRRTERALPVEYRAAIETVLTHLKPQTLDDAIAIARLPTEIRGYESIKLARVNHFRERLVEELAHFTR
jgi:indolepyruvate ferredoxin oxidoreductase